jgi:hypothetical protein
MTDLFDKLNLLLRTSLDSFRHGLQGDAVPLPDPVSPDALTNERSITALERQIATMRKQIDGSLNEEDDIQARLDKFNQQVVAYDKAADAALERGDEAEARRLVAQMQQQRRHATLLKAELEAHKSATSEFIERVNMLEATVADARRAQGQYEVDAPAAATTPSRSPAAEPKPAVQVPPELVELGKATGTAINDVLRTLKERAETALAPLVTTPATPSAKQTPPEPKPVATTPVVPTPVAPVADAERPARRVPVIASEQPITAADAPFAADDTGAVKIKVTAAPVTPAAPAPANPPAPPPPAKTPEDKAVEEDLARRRSRLSKPD